MLEGLEAKEVLFSELIIDNEKFRIDDEFYQNRYLDAYRKVKSIEHDYFSSLIGILTDYHANGSYKTLKANTEILDEPDYAYMVRSTDLEAKNYSKNVKYVSKSSYDFLKKTRLYGGELLINKIGVPGKTYTMPALGIPATLGMNLFMIRLQSKCNYKENYIWAFLNSSLGKNIISRKINGTVPLTIDKEAIRTLCIPRLSPDFQDRIDELVVDSHETLSLSYKAYNQAEQLLLKELGLENFTPENKAVNIKSLSESFGKTGRLDAEYYQSRYDQLFQKLSKNNTAYLGDIVNIKKSIEPGSKVYQDTGIDFIRVANISIFGISGTEIKLPYDLFTKTMLNYYRPSNKTILLSKDGSVGIAYKIKGETEIITSGALLHLTIKSDQQDNILPEYLTLLLNSKLVKMQADRDSGGSIIQHWKPSEIQKVVIPVISKSKQQKVENRIEESFQLSSKSEKLLTIAKKAVEIAIEKNEEMALQYIDKTFQVRPASPATF